MFQQLLLSSIFLSLVPLALPTSESPFDVALRRGEEVLQSGKPEDAKPFLQRALERDPKSASAWDLKARIAAALGDKDDETYSRHVQLRLLIAQKSDRKLLQELRRDLQALDPFAREMLDLREVFISKLEGLADGYEKATRPHSAIRLHQQVLALDPDYQASLEAIDRISSLPDPSLAESAKPKDLFADVSDEWIREYNENHSDWDNKARIERENYITYTDAGYEVLVRAAEAMEQMNAFYRLFFQYGHPGDSRSIPRINLNIFKNRDEYLTLGIGPPVEWSGGHFTGSAVETYIGQGGFESTVGTLFHEAAHQFVSLATNAVGWLNEGLASFFEGCRIQANGTVLMNYPANHRLFPLADRMEGGWMASSSDGIDPSNASDSSPTKAPTFRILIENQYAWGPPWYAPTWGLVFFLYNFQDPWDGRFVYRAAFREYIDASGGKRGDTAIEAFEETVLANPAKPTKTKEKGTPVSDLPKKVDDIDALWKKWILLLRDEQTGRLEETPPYLAWANFAIERGEIEVAQEHFEKGLVATPGDVELLEKFAMFLAGKKKNTDRASKLLLQALIELEHVEEPDEKRIKKMDTLLSKYDKKHRTVGRLHEQLEATARGLAQKYLGANLPTMAMDVSWRLGNELGFSDLFVEFEEAVRRTGKSLAQWRLAYNEKNLEGWLSAGTDTWIPGGVELGSQYETFKEKDFRYRFLTMDTVSSGDYSLEAEVFSEDQKNMFTGLVFGRKDGQNFHSLIYYPGRSGDERYGRTSRTGSVDLTTFYGASNFKIWRHNPVTPKSDRPGTNWHKLRIDITGRMVDVWFDDELVVTQEFPTTDVVRGGFGLITGLGEARWRNVRYLARQPRDPAARIERELLMERLRAEAAAQGRTLGDSWLGLVPPWPKVEAWVQEPREHWFDQGPVPQLFVLWNIQQNEIVPIDEFLRDVIDEYEDSSLRIVSVVANEDKERIGQYLQEHPIPGSVGIDFRKRRGYGETFEQFAVQKFHLPRVLLIDVNGTVAWEGDPGIEAAVGYVRGDTYLDTPLKDLIDRRKLDVFFPWLERWENGGYEALAAGDMRKVAPLLKLADQLDARMHPDLAYVKSKLAILRSALKGMESTAHALAKAEGEAAIDTLIEWAELIADPIAPDVLRELKRYTSKKTVKDWRKAVNWAKDLKKKLKPGGKADVAKGTAAKTAQLSGLFAEIFADQLRRAADSGDADQVLYVLGEMHRIPERWLAEEFFDWSAE